VITMFTVGPEAVTPPKHRSVDAFDWIYRAAGAGR
jgi:hypothetical protein